MANHSEFGGHVEGVRLDQVLHACPECNIGAPAAFCPVCHGQGTVTELELAVWVRIQNAAPQ